MVTYNIKFPLKDDSEKNKFFSLTRISKDAYSSDLLLLLLTQKGERYYQPNYGSNLLKYIFDPSDSLTTSYVEEDIKRTVGEYIPNLKVDNINFVWKENGIESERGNELLVKINFTYSENSFSESGLLELSF